MFTGIGVGLVVGCLVFLLVMLKGDVLAGFFTTDVAVIQKGYAYLEGFAPETILTAILFSRILDFIFILTVQRKKVTLYKSLYV